jgi:hypothetical protein
MSEDRISRRRMLKRIGTGAAVAWTAPVITSIAAGPAYAATATCGCLSDPCLNACGAPGQGCLCAHTTNSGCACFIPACLGPCANDSDCGAGFACVQTCCGPPTCAQFCAGSRVRHSGRAWSRA